MARIDITSSFGMYEKDHVLSNTTSSVQEKFTPISDIDEYATHAYQFHVVNKSENTNAEIFIEVNNSEDDTNFVPIFSGSVSFHPTNDIIEVFYFKEVFNFKYSRIRVRSKEAIFSIYESHTPMFRLTSSSS